MIQEMSDKVVNNHSSTIQFIPECYKSQKMHFFLPFFIPMTNIKIKEFAKELFLMILFNKICC